jgi:hypothetical protein
MKYEVGMRWIWKDSDGHVELKGHIIYIKPRNIPGSNGDRYFITIKWENGRIMQYTDSMIGEDTRLSLDKEWYRNEKLELLGI